MFAMRGACVHEIIAHHIHPYDCSVHPRAPASLALDIIYLPPQPIYNLREPHRLTDEAACLSSSESALSDILMPVRPIYSTSCILLMRLGIQTLCDSTH